MSIHHLKQDLLMLEEKYQYFKTEMSWTEAYRKLVYSYTSVVRSKWELQSYQQDTFFGLTARRPWYQATSWRQIGNYAKVMDARLRKEQDGKCEL